MSSHSAKHKLKKHMQRAAGKLCGVVAGLLFGSWPVLLLGVLFGHIFDILRAWVYAPAIDTAIADNSSVAAQRSSETVAQIVLAAKLCKADGQVTHAKIESFQRNFHFAHGQSREVGRLFDMARADSSGYEPYATWLSQHWRGQPQRIESLLRALALIAQADGFVRSASMDMLQHIALLLGYNAAKFQIFAHSVGLLHHHDQQDAFSQLGLPQGASNDDIRQTYRRLVREHHPDRVMANSRDTLAVAEANERLALLNAAYDELRRLRGL